MCALLIDLGRMCKLATKSIIDGEGHESISKAAKSLEKNEDTVRGAVRALAQILTMLSSSSVYVVSEKVYLETLKDMKLSQSASSAIYAYYKNVHGTLRDVLTQFKIDTARYHSFDWRLDIQIGSRALHRRVDPVYLCELQTSSSNTTKMEKNVLDDMKEDDDANTADTKSKECEKTLFECDYANLENMIEELEQALRETQQSWYKKVSRQTK